jgi:hypothetical protein
MNPDLANLLLAVTSLSAGNYVLIRTGVRRQDDQDQWRINVRTEHREWTTTGNTLLLALARALAKLKEREGPVTNSGPRASAPPVPARAPWTLEACRV